MRFRGHETLACRFETARPCKLCLKLLTYTAPMTVNRHRNLPTMLVTVLVALKYAVNEVLHLITFFVMLWPRARE